ncbi:hypothetical protein [Campylobacter estrildidarum]|uniref:Uncharacterized protein n=1 Tax=Campylobacter estrildidarum TaxID=2510189 RepID=A0A4U7BJ24_9BACT|nr:hypothetical protein [Campylobacter estrildidarum]TKX28916.1 hypothetical protein CQA69_07865 [Campylobacter estrildidarum]
MSSSMLEIQMMNKEEFFNKFKNNDDIRFLFGYANKENYESNDYFEMSLRVWIDRKYFNNPKIKNYAEMIKSFEKTSFFEEFKKQTIKIDFENSTWNLIVPEFFEEHNIEIIPYFQLCDDEDLSPKQFFRFLQEMKVKELKYITYILSSKFTQEEYKYLHKKSK